MEYQIPFKGIALTPYSDTSPDGQLAVCSMLEQRAGGLRPTVIPGIREDLPADLDDLTLIYRHTTSSYARLIFSSRQGLYYAEEDSLQQLVEITDRTDIQSVEAVGNTLVALSLSGLHYYLYTDNGYKYIGDKPSEIDIAFGLTGQTKTEGVKDFTVKAELSDEESYNIVNIAETSEAVWSLLNKEFIEDNFAAPFFIRAAYRMYDGTHYMATAPVLLIPDSKGPRAGMYDTTIGTTTENGVTLRTIKGNVIAHGVTSKITYCIFHYGNIQDWRDIISGVDIFVSRQIYPYKVGGEIKLLGIKENSFGIYSDVVDSGYTSRDFVHYDHYTYFKMPWFSEAEYIEELESAAQFYKIASFSIGFLTTAAGDKKFRELNTEEGWKMENLTLQESLKESNEYQSHDKIIAGRSFLYNRRLHLYGLKRYLFQGFTPEVMWPYTDDGNTTYTIAVWLANPDGTSSIVKTTSSINTLSLVSRFYYYPDANATRMVIYDAEQTPVLDLSLKPHPFLNGAYYAWIDNQNLNTWDAPELPEEKNRTLALDNKLYVSEAENPYRFPLQSIYTIGTGSIIGLSTIATALSQGQFGQFPLMAFCTDGNYTLSVGDEGRYSSIHPMSRDVCVNPRSITQTDSETMFVTSKGVMITSGASASLLSADLDGVPDTFAGEAPDDAVGTEKPIDFFAHCRIVYDYANRRLFFVSVGSRFAYVYSIETASWSTAQLDAVQSVLNAYPYSYIQMGGKLVKLDQPYPYEGEEVEGLIVTRPVKFDSLQYKVLHQITLQGVFSSPQVIKVFGSQDGINWHYLGKSQTRRIGRMAGRPFKYFRFALVTTLSPEENITGLRVGYDIRAERRLR